MARRTYWLPSVVLLIACGAAQRPETLTQMESVRESPAVQHSRATAPQAFAEAEQLAGDAMSAWDAGDRARAAHLSQMATVGYRQALVLARQARAELAAARAAERQQQLESELEELKAKQAKLEAEARNLELRAKVLRDEEPLEPVAAAAPARERARRAAARALLTEAKLLCISETLIREQRHEQTSSLLTEIDEQLSRVESSAAAALIEASRHLRAACLDQLTLARRPTTRSLPNAGLADALLVHLGALPGLHPYRDDRGVVVLLGNPANGSVLSAETERKLAVLAETAAAHPEFSLLLVWHSGAREDDAHAVALLEQARQLLDPEGKKRLASEQVDGAQPIVTPGSRGADSQNRRLEVVFVPSSND